MKRILSIALAVLVSLSVLPVYAEAGAAQVSERAGGLLAALGIIDVSEIDLEAEVTRADMAEYAVKLLNLKPSTGGQKYYTDLSAEDIEKGYINLLTEMGYMTGYGRTFRPSQAITLNEALKVVLSSCGYIELAEGTGGFASGYYKYADSLLKGIDLPGNSGITYAELCVMLYNALFMPVAKAESVGESTKYGIDKKWTVMNEYFNIFEDVGIVTATSKMSVNQSDIRLRDGNIIIDDLIYTDEADLAQQYLGYRVTYYYKDDDSDSKPILYMTVHKMCAARAINLDDVTSDGKNLTYFDGKNEEKLDISNFAAGVYNNAPENISEIYKKLQGANDGRLLLIDHESDGVYDVVFLEVMEFMWIKRVDVNERIVYNESAFGPAAITLDKNDKNSYILKNGAPAGLEKIVNQDAAAVIKNDKTKFVKLDISNKRLIGRVESYDQTRHVAVIEGEEYSIPKNGINTEMKAGLCGIFFITENGYIVNVTVTDGIDATYGYVISSETGKGVENAARFKILQMSGEVKVFQAAKSCRVGTQIIKDAQTLIQSVGTRQLIQYQLNAKNEIIKIELPLIRGTGGYDEDHFSLDREGNMYSRLTTPISIGTDGVQNADNGARATEYFITAQVIIFKVPDDENNLDEQDYSVVSSGYITNDTNYQMEIYDSDRYKIPKAVVLKKESVVNPIETSSLFVIDSVYEEAGENGDVLTKVRGYTALKPVSYTITDKVRDKFFENGKFRFAFGDLIQVSASKDGSIDGINYCFFGDMKKEYSIWPFSGRNSASGGTLEMPKEYEAGTTGIRIADDRYLVFGKAVHVDVNNAVFSIDVPKWNITHSFALSKANIHVVYMNKQKIQPGTISDIMDGDSIFVRSRRQDVGDIVVYKNWR